MQRFQDDSSQSLAVGLCPAAGQNPTPLLSVVPSDGPLPSNDEIVARASDWLTDVASGHGHGLLPEDVFYSHPRALVWAVGRLAEKGRLRVTPDFRDDDAGTLAWVGDTALDFFLAVLGAEAGLKPRALDGIRKELFCTKSLGREVQTADDWNHECRPSEQTAKDDSKDDVRSRAENRERCVGELCMKRISELKRIATEVLQQSYMASIVEPHEKTTILHEISRMVGQSKGDGTAEIACWYFIHRHQTGVPCWYGAWGR